MTVYCRKQLHKDTGPIPFINEKGVKQKKTVYKQGQKTPFMYIMLNRKICSEEVVSFTFTYSQ